MHGIRSGELQVLADEPKVSAVDRYFQRVEWLFVPESVQNLSTFKPVPNSCRSITLPFRVAVRVALPGCVKSFRAADVTG